MNLNYFCSLLVITLCTTIFALDINSCKQEWVQTSTGSYSYRVDCSNLGFKSIPKNIPELTSELLLNGDSISTVDDQSFLGLSSLHTLDLSGNDITTIEESVFEQNTGLRKLDLGRNKLHCDWRIWWLVLFSRKLQQFTGQCFTPRPLRGKLIPNVTQADLSVDCISVKKLTGAIVDGEYSVRVFNHDNSEKEVPIYCHQMKSSKPKEYLTLPSGVHKNFVKISKDENCDYRNDLVMGNFPLSNLTSYFSRVRIKISTLEIITADPTFASSTYLKYGQPTLCGKKICLKGLSRIDLRGTHFKLKLSKQVIEERSCKVECGLCEVSETIQLDLIDQYKQPFPACTYPLGLQDNEIPDRSITASSSAGKHFQPYFARLNSLMFSGWCASKMDGGQYLLVDLGKQMTLSGISSQGHKDRKDWVSAYRIMYSLDGNKYSKYQQLGQKMTFVGNTDSNTVVTHWFMPRFRARFVRVHPMSWNDDGILEHKICMRIELYGCESDITSYIIKPSSDNQCLTADFSIIKREYALKKFSKCTGADFMFTYHHNRLIHTKTGLCLNVNKLAFVLNENCQSPNLMFQKVRHTAGEAFLIKDLNGYCARLIKNGSSDNLYADWKYCQLGGFTILQMSREGVVAFPPYFNESSHVIQTDLFKMISITCKANADPFPVYKWKKLSNIDTFGYQIQSKFDHEVIVFRNITWDNRGSYSCTAWNSEGSVTKVYEIIVNPLQWFHRVPTNQNVIYGRNALFFCESHGIPRPEVSWLLYNSISNKYTNVSILDGKKYVVNKDGTLRINKVEYNDKTSYVCVSESPGLVRNTTATLSVYVTQNFTAVPQSANVLYGSDVIFECVSEGEPTPKLEWQATLKKFGSIMVIDESYSDQYQVLKNGSLLVKQADIEDQGDYYCVSYSPGLVKNVKASLTVYVEQEFVLAPKNARVLYGSNHVLDCLSKGIPKPTATWQFKRKGLQQAQTITHFKPGKYKMLPNGNLEINNGTVDDSGEYYCISHSPGLIRNVSATVDFFITQKFTEKPTSVIKLIGQSATLKCRSDGVPKPKISWQFESILGFIKTFPMMIKTNKYSIREDRLTVHRVLNKDEGRYICVSKSPGYTVNISASLTVHIKPQVSISKDQETVLVGQPSEVLCTSGGDPTPVIKWFKLKVNSSLMEKEIDTKSGILRFVKSQKQNEGRYACQATNAAGKSFAIFNFTVKATCLLEVIKHSQKPQKYIYTETEKVVINCTTGFQLMGASELTCTMNGTFNHPTPFCEDIDECEQVLDSDNGSGRPSNQTYILDSEQEVCGDNAQCVNTVGSYRCACDEGYQMISNNCEYISPGDKPLTTTPSTTTPLPKDYTWLQILMQKYKDQLVDEGQYLQRLKEFSAEIPKYVHSVWKVVALEKLLNALSLTVNHHNLILPSTPRTDSLEFIKTFVFIADDVFKAHLAGDWKKLDKKMNGSVLLMKYIEQYIVQSSKLLIFVNFGAERISITSQNLDVTIQQVTKLMKDQPLRITSSEGSSNEVNVPTENYKHFKDSVAILILYKTLHRLLPTASSKDVNSPKILSEVLSLSFSKESPTQLDEPVEIKFNIAEGTSPQERYCSFWDFKKPYGGGWSSEGCKVSNSSSSSEIICECSHLTNFAVIVPSESSKVIYLTYILALLIGTGVCVFFLCLTCASNLCCTRYVRSDRPTILCNVTMTILLAILAFGSCVFVSSYKLVPRSFTMYFCYCVLGSLQFFGTAFFAWLFAEALHLLYSTRTIIDKGHGHLLLFYFIGWVLPFFVLAGTAALVYLDQFDLQARCILRVSYYLPAILIGGPCLLFILATFATYVIVGISASKNRDLLGAHIISHTKRALMCSTGLILIHLLVLVAAVVFLRYNETPLYHYVLAGLLALEGIYLALYHCFFDKMDIKKSLRQNSKKRNSYSTKETVTYSPNNTNEVNEVTEDKKYLIKTSSKRLSGEPSKPSPPQLRTHNGSEEAEDWNNSYVGMYGGGSPKDVSSPELRPLLTTQPSEDLPQTIYEEEDGGELENPVFPTFGHLNSSRTNSVPNSRHNSLPRKKMWDEMSNDSSHRTLERSLKRSSSKGSSIVSIETHTSSKGGVLPVYFPSAPPQYEMSLQQSDNQMKLNSIDSYLDSADDSRPTSFGIDSDRMSNISSELSNILYELQAFDTKRHPSETHECVYGDVMAKTLPNNRNHAMTDISRNHSSTFKPKRTYAKGEHQKRPDYSENNRVRILRGRSRAEADPSDGLHHSNSDSMYSSL